MNAFDLWSCSAWRTGNSCGLLASITFGLCDVILMMVMLSALLAASAFAQTTVGTGSIVGTVTDPSPPNTMSGLLTGTPGSINGTTGLDNEAFRVGNGTGVYAVGAGRQVEWGMKLTF